jgi:hypothetical protein
MKQFRGGAMLIDDLFENIWFALFICYGAPAIGVGALTLVDDTIVAGHMNNEDYSPLTVPVLRDNVKVADLRILNGADVRKKDKYLWTPLHFVRSKEMAELLIEGGAEVNARCSRGNTPLHTVFHAQKDWAATSTMGHNVTYGDEKMVDLVDFLISKGADLKAKNDRGETPLQKFLTYAEGFELRRDTAGKIENLLRRAPHPKCK